EIDQDLKTEVLSQMVELKAGNFDMGGNGKYDGSPIHNVTISNSFYIGKYTVTQKLWKRVMGSLPEDSDYRYERFRGDLKPVIDVSWYDCMDFIIKLNAKTGLQFRLPTEAEWEYACRCSGVDKYKLDDVAWYSKNSERQLHEVGTTKKSSELAIQDMLGNVWEWCSDWDGFYRDEPQVDPQGPSLGSNRVNRGGGWGNDADFCRVAYRSIDGPYGRHASMGFRLALSLQFKK
ncbi:MAG: formylglycine-generating enzyme family protein, partial [Bacteroidales bacterium]|nr:formylglycine-generating enzyme family protein [Bacteroidales bacterium]